MAGETSNGGDLIKVEASVAAAAAAAEPKRVVEPIQQRCCNHDVVRYNECRRNHAACSGHYVFDGCGEFIRSSRNRRAGGDANDIYKCAACGCHRNFHRKGPPIIHQLHHNNVHFLPPPPPAVPPPLLLAPLPLASHQQEAIRTAESESDATESTGEEKKMEMEMEMEMETKTTKKKRAKRTNLTVEMKKKLMGFADKLGWKPQKHDGAEIQRFCDEVGITKRVLTVWMNNNRRRKDLSV